MRNNFKNDNIRRRTVSLLLCVFFIPVLLCAQVHKIPLPKANPADPDPTFDYNFPFNQNIASGTAEVGVQTGLLQVAWDFGIGGAPGGLDPSGKFFTFQNVKVELP